MKEIESYSKDQNSKISKKTILIISIFTTFILIIASYFCFNAAVDVNPQTGAVKYSENGDIDYKVYLKNNNYYNSNYLEKGMLYVASLIKNIKVNFNYQIHSNQDIDYNTNYKITGELQITEKDQPTKVLYSKTEDLVNNKNIITKDKNIVIDEEINIDYDKYNNLVNAYKKEYGLFISSNLILTLQADTKGSVYNNNNALDKANKLQISIPLSEQTVNINIDTDEIKTSGTILNSKELFTISNNLLFVIFILLVALTTANIILSIYLYIKYFKKDIYNKTLSKILNDYDRIIVNGKVTINEKNYEAKIYPDTFEEMVDAAQQLEVPIYFYETIPNEQCFFVIVKDKTLYKYKLNRSHLENKTTNALKNENKNIENEDNINKPIEEKEEIIKPIEETISEEPTKTPEEIVDKQQEQSPIDIMIDEKLKGFANEEEQTETSDDITEIDENIKLKHHLPSEEPEEEQEEQSPIDIMIDEKLKEFANEEEETDTNVKLKHHLPNEENLTDDIEEPQENIQQPKKKKKKKKKKKQKNNQPVEEESIDNLIDKKLKEFINEEEQEETIENIFDEKIKSFINDIDN